MPAEVRGSSINEHVLDHLLHVTSNFEREENLGRPSKKSSETIVLSLALPPIALIGYLSLFLPSVCNSEDQLLSWRAGGGKKEEEEAAAAAQDKSWTVRTKYLFIRM